MIKNFLFISILSSLLILIFSFKTYAQQSCDQFLKECISNSEGYYKECLDNKILADFKCKSMGYKPYSKDFRMCVDDITNYWEKECRKNYHQHTENCYKTYKNCRKGDVLGIVHISFREKGNICSSPYKEREGSYTLVGIWKKQTSESYGYIQSFKPENLQIVYNYNETALEHNENCPSLMPHQHECPIILWEIKDGSAKGYPLDSPFDGPASRIQIYSMPNMGPIYRAALPGMAVSVEGKKHKGNSPPDCFQSVNYSRQISVGSFSISDDVLPNGDMKGSESWKSCGHPFQDKIGFGIGRDKLSSKAGKKKDTHSPSKYESCPSGEEVLINTNWKFYLIK